MAHKHDSSTDDQSDVQSDDLDMDFNVTKKMLIANSDTECEEYVDEDEDFTQRIVERYGGNVSFIYISVFCTASSYSILNNFGVTHA